MITIRQIDAALGLLGLNRSDLAEQMGFNKSTFNAYFTGKAQIPSGKLGEIQKWLENSGIVFTEQGGVNPNTSDIIVYEGKQGFQTFMVDVMETAQRGGTDICISNVDESKWETNLSPVFAEYYRAEMQKVKGLSSRILVKEGDDFLTAEGFAQYRGVPASVFSDEASFYAYGEKLAIITFHNDDVQVLLLKNKQFSDSFRSMFNAVWNNHEVLR
jgi:hypothetical protein